MTLNELRDTAYQTAVQHGFHDEEHEPKHYLMLILTEVSEMVEADRNGKKANIIRYVEDLDNGKLEFERAFEYYIKDSFQDEMADVVIRLLDMAGAYRIELQMSEHLDYRDVLMERPFIINAFYLCKLICGAEGDPEGDYLLSHIIKYVYDWADIMKVDIVWHVRQKMEYNNTRPFRNGKQY